MHCCTSVISTSKKSVAIFKQVNVLSQAKQQKTRISYHSPGKIYVVMLLLMNCDSSCQEANIISMLSLCRLDNPGN